MMTNYAVITIIQTYCSSNGNKGIDLKKKGTRASHCSLSTNLTQLKILYLFKQQLKWLLVQMLFN